MTALQQSTATEIAAGIAELFDRWPALTGFSLQEHDTLTADRDDGPVEGALYLADLAIEGWAFGTPRDLHSEIVGVLAELLDEHPEAFELLRGRTFARTLH